MLRRAALVIVPLAAAAAQVRGIADPDVWWHLRGATLVLSQGRWWVRDDGSFLHAGVWWNTEWAGQLVAWSAWTAGGPVALQALVALCAGLCAWATLRAVPEDAPPAALPLAVLAQLAVADHWAPRPQSAMLLAVALALGARAPTLVLWSAAQLLWAHVHASHVLLPVFPAAMAVDAAARGAPAAPWARVALTCALVALLANPLGPGIVAEVLDHAGTDAARHIGDMRPPTLTDLWPQAWGPGAAGLIVFATALVALVTDEAPQAPRAGRLRDVVLFVLGVALAATAVRFRAPGALLALPLASRVAARLPSGGALAVALAPLPLLWAVGQPGWGILGVRAERLPVDAARVLAAHGPGTLWNHYDDGGWLSWRLPGWTLAIDGRTPTFFPASAHARWRQSKLSLATFRALHAAHDLDAALVPRDVPLCALLRDAPEWRAAYADLDRVLYVPRASPIPGALRALAACAGDPAPTCADLAVVASEVATLMESTPDARFPRIARMRLGACGADPGPLADTAAAVLAGDPGPDRMAALRALLEAGRAEEALDGAADAVARFPEPDWAMVGVTASGGALSWWDEAARRYDDGMPRRLRLAYARALAEGGRGEEAVEQALRAAWAGEPEARALLDRLPLDDAAREERDALDRAAAMADDG